MTRVLHNLHGTVECLISSIAVNYHCFVGQTGPRPSQLSTASTKLLTRRSLDRPGLLRRTADGRPAHQMGGRGTVRQSRVGGASAATSSTDHNSSGCDNAMLTLSLYTGTRTRGARARPSTARPLHRRLTNRGRYRDPFVLHLHFDGGKPGARIIPAHVFLAAHHVPTSYTMQRKT